MEEIAEFINDQKALMIHLSSFRAQLRDILPLKVQERQYYLKFSAFLEKYEENKQSKSGQVGALSHVRLISGPGNDHLKQKLERMGQDFENPFIHISNWVKGEQYSLDALIQSVEEMYSIDS